MVKCLTRILQLRVNTVVFYILWIIAIIHFFSYHGKYNYASITRDEIKTVLYKAVNPNLKVDSTIGDCKYDLLKSTRTLNTWDVPKSYDNFSAVGIVNGSYYPKHCRPLYSVAVLVTYRNRQRQLDVFVPYIHNFMRKQDIHYKIYLIEQKDDKPWNKGALYNIGARHAIADKFPCLILQDVDLLPLDEANLYACLREPRHLSGSIDKFRFILPYEELVGGVAAIRATQYIQVNGFSNRFYGWGAEDDDFYSRLTLEKLNLLRLPHTMSRYTMLQHRQEPRNNLRHTIRAQNMLHHADDGYGQVPYRTAHVKHTRLFTVIGVWL